jgi:hypothetical protein
MHTKFRLNANGGSYVVYFRASANANLHANTGLILITSQRGEG